MKHLAITLILLALTVGSRAQAAEPAIPLVSIGGRGGFGSYVMSDMNVAISNVNDVLTDPRNRFDELNKFGSGVIGGGDLRIRVLPNLALSLTIDYVYESSKVGLEVVGEEFQEVDIYACTAPLTARVLYVVRNSERSGLVYTMGGGISYLWLGRLRTQSSEGIATISIFPSAEYRTADGDGIGAQVSGGVDYFIKPWLSVGGELVYRYAKISELTYNDNGDTVVLANGNKLSLDFSGFNMLACVRTHVF
jgi:hypothetical protein